MARRANIPGDLEPGFVPEILLVSPALGDLVPENTWPIQSLYLYALKTSAYAIKRENSGFLKKSTTGSDNSYEEYYLCILSPKHRKVLKGDPTHRSHRSTEVNKKACPTDLSVWLIGPCGSGHLTVTTGPPSWGEQSLLGRGSDGPGG
ncbi:hypothetical protein J6590_069294 [Homalodisca vitripennis]|nr:hypothetical protein J6590_069294 [Homalodisca vitripennis]